MRVSRIARNQYIHHSGFTLIELLIAIIIIGILSALGISTFQSAQKKSRDLSRKTALATVAKALETYMNDKGVYPPSSPDGKILWCGTVDAPDAASCPWGHPLTDITTGETPTVYLAALPQDSNAAQTYFYEAVPIDGVNKGYRLYARLENTKDPDIPETGQYNTNCGVGTTSYCNYVLTSDAVAQPLAYVTMTPTPLPTNTPTNTPAPTCPSDGSICSTGADCCSGVCTVFYEDADRDTYGNSANSTKRCGAAFSGYVTDNTDCDDRDPAAHTKTDTSGGVITTSGGYRIHTFTSSGTFTPRCISSVEVLVVAGGGGGGGSWKTNHMVDGCNGPWGGSGGGGGGGVIHNTGYTVTSGTSIPVTVGAGGRGVAINTPYKGSSGGNSVFGSLAAIGGGGGAGVTHAYSSGISGGSGGGAGYECISFRCRDGASGIPGQGNSGGRSCFPYGGGGGGAGAAASANSGGAGKAFSISGTTKYYAGGGGGGGGGVGGIGGGGCKVSEYMCPPDADPNTGGGGGGTYSFYKASGNGGSGIVIVRYQL